MRPFPTQSKRSLARIFIHFVWRTRGRTPCIDSSIAAVLEELLGAKCHELRGELVAAGFADNHAHVLAQIDPSTPVMEFARQLKGFSSRIISTRYPDFVGWQEGYYAESVNWRDLDRVARYLRDQRDHHRREPLGRVAIHEGLTLWNVASIDDLPDLSTPDRVDPESSF